MNQVHVLLPKPFDHGFDYGVPDGMQVAVGDYVRVNFGRQSLIGVVWGPGRNEVAAEKVKPLAEHFSHLPPMQESMRAFIQWVARYTLAPMGMVLKMAIPVEEAIDDSRKRRKAEPSAVAFTGSPATLGKPLSPSQQGVAERLAAKLGKGFSVTVVDGVTGSGKTEVYFDTVAKAGGQCLVLLPEIALSTQWVERCKARFGVVPVLWHSGLTPAKRRDSLRSIMTGEAKLVVGARSALFLPYKDLSLIVVDEEHEQSYKQEDGVLYHARDMAVARGHIQAVPVVLVSATPSLETVQNVIQKKYDLAHLPERHGGVQMPEVGLLDLREEILDRGTWLSYALRRGIADTLAAGKQVMLFLNRRGYAPLLLCRGCGYRFACPACSSWMVLHGNKAGGRLQCHHCDHREKVPSACPACAKEDSLVPCGPGVERVAEEVRQLFPQARVEMMTSDTMDSLKTAEDTVAAMTGGAIDILVGTQMMAKGYHFPQLHLIGVVDADLGLQGGDLRAGERTFQLLQQVAGRAGREQERGKVLLQTYLPDHPVMQALAANDREGLEKMELEARRDAMLPPFGRLAAVIVDGAVEAEVVRFCQQLARTIPTHPEIRILGPAAAPITRLRGRYRYRFLVRAPRNISLQAYMTDWLGRTAAPSAIRVRVDIDPYSFF